jgi:hypothetical protein
MARPVYITPAGDLGIIPENVFYQIPILAEDPGDAFTADVVAGSKRLNNVNISDWTWIWYTAQVSGPGIPSNTKITAWNQSQRWIDIDKSAISTVPESNLLLIRELYYVMIAGELPDGVQCRRTGIIEGIPKAVASLQGVPTEVSKNVTSRFTVRTYNERYIGNIEVIDRVADRTFSLTVTGQDVPEFVTPPGNIGTFYDGTPVSIPIVFTDPDPNESLTIGVVSGELPPGLNIDPRTGIISGVIAPLVGPPGTAAPGYDVTQFDQFPWDFSTRSASKNYQFALGVSDGKDINVRTFTIFVYSKDSMSADTDDFTADNTFITADVVPTRTPVLLTIPGDLGVIRADNFFAFKFDAIDFDGDPIEYSITTGTGIGYDETLFDQTGVGFDRGTFSLPPGLQIDPFTGWFYGYVPNQGVTQFTYQFAIRVRKIIPEVPLWNNTVEYQPNDVVRFGGVNYTARTLVPAGVSPANLEFWTPQPEIISDFYYFTVTIVGDIDTEVRWLSPENLGTINNGAISLFNIAAVNVGGRALQYQLASGSPSKLPQGLTLLPSGNIAGRVSFNTFALDGGTTTFDVDIRTRLVSAPTTFDTEYNFTVNAFSAQTEQLGFRVASLNIANGGTGYSSNPVITISAPPATVGSIQATVSSVTVVDGVITSIVLGNPGQGYISPPTVTVSDSTGNGAVVTALIQEINIENAISVFKTFKITVNREFNEPYERLYIKCMPPQEDRNIITNLVQNQDIIPENLVYRADDPNFGVAKNVIYDHAYGLAASSLAEYYESIQLNHYWRNITLGNIKTAQAVGTDGQVMYEVVYSEVIDDLVNNQGLSTGESLNLPYPPVVNGNPVPTVYPNSLTNMQNRVINTVGQISPALPLWMTSKQSDGRVLGFTPAWVIAYVKPGESSRVAYNIRTQFGNQLNLIDYKIDRYELDRSQTYNWDSETEQWIPTPALVTTFDAVSRPSNLQFRGFVDYCTTLGFSEINGRTLSEIAARGGIDGVVGRQLENQTLIFFKQESFGRIDPDELFTDYLEPYDSTGYDATGNLYDEAVVLTPAQRLYVYRITIGPGNIVQLVLDRTTVINDYVSIRFGRTFAGNELYIPITPPVGLSNLTWAYIPETPNRETIFDGNTTRFIAPSDRWQPGDDFDKYIVFSKTNILG